MASGLNYEQVIEWLLHDGFKLRMVMAMNLGTVGEYVYLWDQLLAIAGSVG